MKGVSKSQGPQTWPPNGRAPYRKDTHKEGPQFMETARYAIRDEDDRVAMPPKKKARTEAQAK